MVSCLAATMATSTHLSEALIPSTQDPVRESAAEEDRRQEHLLERRRVEASLRGDESAFAALIRRHERRVFRLAGRFFRRAEDVEEVAQETFLTAWRKLETYRADAPFEHWLTRICLNCCYLRLRREKPAAEEIDPELAAPQGDPNARPEVRGLLRRLAPQDRFILLLLDGQGWSVAEIAGRLGWSRANVKVRAHRARKRLRRILEEEIEP